MRFLEGLLSGQGHSELGCPPFVPVTCQTGGACWPEVKGVPWGRERLGAGNSVTVCCMWEPLGLHELSKSSYKIDLWCAVPFPCLIFNREKQSETQTVFSFVNTYRNEVLNLGYTCVCIKIFIYPVCINWSFPLAICGVLHDNSTI